MREQNEVADLHSNERRWRVAASGVIKDPGASAQAANHPAHACTMLMRGHRTTSEAHMHTRTRLDSQLESTATRA